MAEVRQWTTREAELLQVTLDVLRENGYDRLTVDEVVSRARASKATVYRRWPSKAGLVLAAFQHGVSQVAVAPNTGSLRGDLLALAQAIAGQADGLSAILTAVLVEARRDDKLRSIMETEFLHQRKSLIHEVLHQAARRGEIDPAVISDEIWDVLPGYLIFRTLAPSREITEATLVAVVDELLLPSLTRRRVCTAAPGQVRGDLASGDPTASPVTTPDDDI